MVTQDQYVHQPKAIASYSSQELLSNQGYLTFYGYITENSAGTKGFHFTENILVSQIPAVAHNAVGASPTNVDYDITSEAFKVPRIVEGNVIINFGIGALTNAGSPSSGSFVIKLYHYDGTTETQLGSTFTSRSFPTGTTLVSNEDICLSKFEVPETLFKVGDMFRVNVQIVPGAYAQMSFGMDPSNYSLTTTESARAWGGTPGSNCSIIDTTEPRSSTQFIIKLPLRVFI